MSFWLDEEPADDPPFDMRSMPEAQIARFSDPGGGIVHAADSEYAREVERIDAEWGDHDLDHDPDGPPSDAELSPLDYDREGLALALFVVNSPGTPADYELPAYQRALIARYEAGTLTPMVRAARTGRPYEAPHPRSPSMSANPTPPRPVRAEGIAPKTWDGTIPEGYPEWWRPGLQMPSWWKPGMPLGDESIELDEEDEAILDKIWDDIAREDDERKARELRAEARGGDGGPAHQRDG